MTTTRVSSSLSAQAREHAGDAVGVGVVDEVTAPSCPSAASPSASATNIGPRAEPPMPIESNWVNRPACLRLDLRRECTFAANALTAASVSRISAAISASGPAPARAASSGRPSGSRPGLAIAPFSSASIAAYAFSIAGAMRAKKPSSNCIRLMSRLRPTAGPGTRCSCSGSRALALCSGSQQVHAGLACVIGLRDLHAPESVLKA